MSYLKSLGKIQIAVLFLILANVIWGAALPIYKWSLANIPPFTFAFLRFYIGALIVFPFVYKNLYVKRSDVTKLAAAALVGITIQIPLLFFGLKLSPSINAPIIIASGPIILIIASVLFLHEKIKAKVITGALISLVGVLTIILRPLLESGGLNGSIIGSIMIFGTTICSVTQAVLLKKISSENSPLTLAFWMFIIGAIPLLPFMLYEWQTFNIFTNLNFQGLVGLGYAIVFSTVIAHYFYIYGIKYTKASDVGIFTYVDPVATIIVAVPLLGETITLAYILGAILVFLGIFIAEGRLHYHPFQKLRFKEA